MVTQPNRERISRVLARVVCGFSTFILAVVLSTHLNPLGPRVSPGDVDDQLFTVVVARVEIPIGTPISAEQLTVAKFSRSVAIQEAFHSIDDKLLGRVALARFMPHEILTESQLAPIGSKLDLIPEGYRAITVRVDEVAGVSRFISPGTMVDVVVVLEPTGSSNPQDRVLSIILKNIKVLASRETIEGEAGPVKTVTLLVTPEQAEKLSVATTQGKLQLRDAHLGGSVGDFLLRKNP